MFDASTLEVFIASTNDLMDERVASEDVLRTWNQSNGSTRQIILKPLRWEKDATPELGPGGFQEVINSNLLDNADILIGIIGKRLGSPTKTSIAGTVDEIEQFYQAKKPVLLFFSDREFNLSEIDIKELQKVRDFRKKMQDLGLYLTFTSIDDYKVKLRNSLDNVLKDFRAMLLPAGRALAYGYYKNFVDLLHYNISDYETVELSDFLLPDTNSPLQVSYSNFHVHIAKPLSLDDVSDNAGVKLKKELAEISIRTRRRAFRVYVRPETKAIFDKIHQDNLKNFASAKELQRKITIECLEVLDYPTPLIALKDFVDEVEHTLSRGKQVQDTVSGYWQRQKTVQHESFFDTLSERIMNKGQADTITFFDCGNQPGKNIPHTPEKP